MAAAVEIDAALVEEAEKLDKSDLNKSNIAFSRLSMKVASQLLSASSPPSLADLESKFAELATKFNSKDGKPAFCSLEGVAYAVNAVKIRSISAAGHIMVTVPFYCEFERGTPATEENPNGEESPIQKLEEALFLLSFNDKISMEIIFMNDTIAEKQDEKDGGSRRLFKKALLEYSKSKELAYSLETTAGDEDFDCMKLLGGRLCVKFDSCEIEATKGSKHETPEEKRKRLENRDENGKLRERKGGAVLAGMELDMPAEYAEKTQRVIRCLVDGDSAHPVASFVGDAAYSILEKGNTAYLGNMKHSCTCISRPDEGEGAAGGSTQFKVMNRKLFFSGFIVPFLFPELSLKYKYTGTTQLPIKAFRGDIDFAKAKLTTVQPNVDLGMLALLCSCLNAAGGSIDSGPVTIRDNVASSTMTTDDLGSEWTKTYGPIFTSAVGLCRVLKPVEFKDLQEPIVKFIESMTLKHYEVLFGTEASSNADVVSLFSAMKKFQSADDRAAVLQEVGGFFDKLFAA
mmetsp:Transcript_16895/g.30609  ORF Transcript_16895/g.30609 Transcript_16895/m.30609 type:complete len:515 (-) Transcript_16895:21-1565(-)